MTAFIKKLTETCSQGFTVSFHYDVTFFTLYASVVPGEDEELYGCSGIDVVDVIAEDSIEDAFLTALSTAVRESQNERRDRDNRPPKT